MNTLQRTMRSSQRPPRTIFCQSSRLAARAATCCQNCSCFLQFTGLPRSNRSAFIVSENRRLGRPRPLAPPVGMKTSTSYSTVSVLRNRCPVHRSRFRCRCTELMGVEHQVFAPLRRMKDGNRVEGGGHAWLIARKSHRGSNDREFPGHSASGHRVHGLPNENIYARMQCKANKIP